MCSSYTTDNTQFQRRSAWSVTGVLTFCTEVDRAGFYPSFSIWKRHTFCPVFLPHKPLPARNSLTPLLAQGKEVQFLFQCLQIRRKLLTRLFFPPIAEVAGGMSLSAQKVWPEDEVRVVRGLSPALGCLLVTLAHHFFTSVCHFICKRKHERKMRDAVLEQGEKHFEE